MSLIIEVDEDQADWGSTKIYGDGDLPGLWVPDKGIGHWGGRTTPPLLHVNCRRILRGWQRYHIGKGWRDIAYNYPFCNHGVTFRARGWNPSGATSGDWEGDGIRENAEAVAIVHIGGSGGSISKKGFEAAGRLWRQVQAVIDADPEVGIGHRDVRHNTTCPGNQYHDWIWRKGWVIAPPPPPPDPIMEGTMLPLFYGDGVKNGVTLTHPASGNKFVTKRFTKRSDVAAIQGMLRRAGAVTPMSAGVYDEAMAAAMLEVTSTAQDTPYTFHGNDWDPVLFAAYGAAVQVTSLQRGDTVTLT